MPCTNSVHGFDLVSEQCPSDQLAWSPGAGSNPLPESPLSRALLRHQPLPLPRWVCCQCRWCMCGQLCPCLPALLAVHSGEAPLPRGVSRHYAVRGCLQGRLTNKH